MLHFRKPSTIPFTPSQFHIGQTSAMAFNNDNSGMSTCPLWRVAADLLPTFCLAPRLPNPNESGSNQEIASSAATTVGLIWLLIQFLPEHKCLAAFSPIMQCCCSHSKEEPREIYAPHSFRELVTHFSVCLSSPFNAPLKVPLFVLCLVVAGSSSNPNLICLAKYHMACIIPTQITRAIFQLSVQCDWHQTAFSPIIQAISGYNFASLNTGAVVSQRLMMLGFEPTPPSTVLGDSAEACWSFHGTAGMFGVILDTASIVPSHVVIHQHHQFFNLTASLCCSPCQVTVWGMVDGDQNMKLYSLSPHGLTSTLTRVPPLLISKRGIFLPLADIEFDITAPSLSQTFALYNKVKLWGIDFGIIMLDIRNNWGGDTTLLCSVCVYGEIGKVDM